MFAMKFYKAVDYFEFKKTKYSEMTKLVHLVEDIKWLTQTSSLFV